MQSTTQQHSRGFSIGLIFMINAFVYICMSLYTPYLSAYFAQNGLSAQQIGILLGMTPFAAILIQPLWAHYADRSGRRKLVLSLLCIGGSASMILLYLSSGFWQFFFAMMVMAAFMTSQIPISDSIVITRANELRLPFASVRLGGTLGYAVAVTISGFFFRHQPDMMFPITAGMLMFFFILVQLLPKNKPVQKPRHPEHKTTYRNFAKYINREYRYMLVFALIGFTGLSFTMSYLGVYIIRLGYDQSMIGISNAIAALCEVPMLLYIRRWKGDRSPITIIAICCMIMGLRTMLAGLGTLYTILISQSLQSVTYIPLYYLCVVFSSTRLPASCQSKGQSLISLIQMGLGGLVGYIFGGWLIDHVGIGTAYMMFSAFMIVGSSVALLFFLHGNRKLRDAHEKPCVP